MWDERSFSTVSYDQRSWFFGIVEKVRTFVKQIVAKLVQTDIFVLTTSKDVKVRK